MTKNEVAFSLWDHDPNVYVLSIVYMPLLPRLESVLQYTFSEFKTKITPQTKGPSIKDVSPEGEGGGYPQKET